MAVDEVSDHITILAGLYADSDSEAGSNNPICPAQEFQALVHCLLNARAVHFLWTVIHQWCAGLALQGVACERVVHAR